MERGTVRTINGNHSAGAISDAAGRSITFNSSHIVGRDRTSLRTGDQVWFERAGNRANTYAINIRRC